MENKYKHREEAEKELAMQYEKHGEFIVAYDFDNTIRDFPSGEPLEDVIALIKRCQSVGMITYLWTCRSENRLSEAVEYCNKYGLYPTHINDMPNILGATGRKPYYNILLDDKAGLDSSMLTLNNVLTKIENDLLHKRP